MSDAIKHFLAIANLSRVNPSHDLLHSVRKSLRIIQSDKALHSSTLDQKMALGARANIPRIPGGIGSGTAYNDSRPESDVSNHSIADNAGRIVKIDIYSVGTGFIQSRIQVVR